MLWIKALHLITVISWFAGLFYLPRLFVNHAMIEDATTRKHLALMEYKLYRFMTPIGLLAIISGLTLWLCYDFSGGWLHIKLSLVMLLVVYHAYCRKILHDFAKGTNRHNHVYYRWINEIPAVLLVAIVILVVLKPFSP